MITARFGPGGQGVGWWVILRSQAGYSLIELVAVMAIFVTIVTALVTLFSSGTRAELDLNSRFEAQQNARLALDKLRRELHCSSGVTRTDGTALPPPPTRVAAVKVSLPSHCPTAGGVSITVVYEAVEIVAGSRYELRRAGVKIADYITRSDPFMYTAQSPASRALLNVDFPVNIHPNEGWKQWRLVDDIVLRNTLRQDP